MTNRILNHKVEVSVKNILLFYLFTFLPLAIEAQTLTVSAPAQVSAGENFRISYTVSTQDVDDFRSGIHSNDVAEIIAGPYTSTQSSFQMTNGHTTSSSSITYTYTLYAHKNGTFNVPAATATVDGRQIQSKATKVTVTGTARQQNGAPNMHQDNEPQMRAAGSKISGNDLFIKVSANKRRVHEQEPVLLTYKVYTLVDLTQLNGKMPDLTGFHTQEIPLPQQKSFHVEQVNGRPYRCVTWSQYVMYPQMTGKLEIPSITFKGIVVQQNRSVDPFEAFFNGGSGYVEVKQDIIAPSLTIQVDPLPAKPANFSGGVGQLNISAQIDKTDVKAGDPISLRVVVGGTGNLKLIKQPTVDFPKDFDKYDAKVTDKTKLTSNGVEGNMIYDFLAVPRNPGKFTIPPVELVYYDTSANAYRTVKSQAFDINVEKGSGKNSTVADYAAEKEKDIRGIKISGAHSRSLSSGFFGSTAYWVSLLLPLLAFIVLLIVFRKRAIDNADLGKMRGKRANKVATKRLRKARQLMSEGKQGDFYDEVLRALWGYVGDKLNMPVEALSRENISEKLHAHEVDESTEKLFLGAIDECEFERYAPGDSAGNMNKTFEAAMKAIEQIETTMKKRKMTKNIGKKTLLFYLFILLPLTSLATPTKDAADEAYKRGHYQQAIADYDSLIKVQPTAELYYNLGNAHFRTDNITQAILAYERALQLKPGDNDIRFNLEFARSKTIDKITPESELFFFSWYRSLIRLTSVDGWARFAVVSIALALLLLLLYLFATRVWLRQVGFFGAILFLALFLVSNLFAYQQKQQNLAQSGAVIVAPSVSVKKTPDTTGTESFLLHEGTRVTITDRSIANWIAVRLDDGREGWIETTTIEVI